MIRKPYIHYVSMTMCYVLLKQALHTVITGFQRDKNYLGEFDVKERTGFY
jgi:hypothetical protein